VKLTVNGVEREAEAAEDTPLLWVLRDHLNLTGTKFGCGMAQCGACTVLVDGEPVRSCVTPAGEVTGAVTTIEGLAPGPGALHPVQAAWIAEEASQCGYCQPGQIMAAVALLAAVPNPSDADIDAALAGHICRCGAYPQIRAAIRRAAGAPGDTAAG